MDQCYTCDTYVAYSFLPSTISFVQDLDLDYCTSFGALHLEALLPLSASLERLSLKGCLIADDCLSSMLGKMSQANGGTGTRLLSLDLSAVDHAGSQRVGDVSCQAISVSTCTCVDRRSAHYRFVPG